MFRNTMPRYEILSEDAMAALDRGWRRLISEVGVEFMSEEALGLFRAAGQRVEENTVFLDPEFVLEQVAKAPRQFDMQARNPANNVHIGRLLCGMARSAGMGRWRTFATSRASPSRTPHWIPQAAWCANQTTPHSTADTST